MARKKAAAPLFDARTFLVIAPNVIVFERLRADFAGGPAVVLNDEAHHTHDEESEWNKTIRRLHAAVPVGLAAQFDFTATPRHTKGQLFSWTVFDYPLKQAIIDNIVKRPLKGVAKGIAKQPSQMAKIRYQAYLAAGVERWKEYRDQLAPLGRKPVLFVMMYDTAKADDVGDWLQKKYPTEFGGARLLVIHANRSGEVAVEDRAARLWCENATRLTDKPWSYLKVPQADYGRLQATRFADVAYLEEGERRAN